MIWDDSFLLVSQLLIILILEIWLVFCIQIWFNIRTFERTSLCQQLQTSLIYMNKW